MIRLKWIRGNYIIVHSFLIFTIRLKLLNCYVPMYTISNKKIFYFFATNQMEAFSSNFVFFSLISNILQVHKAYQMTISRKIDHHTSYTISKTSVLSLFLALAGFRVKRQQARRKREKSISMRMALSHLDRHFLGPKYALSSILKSPNYRKCCTIKSCWSR